MNIRYPIYEGVYRILTNYPGSESAKMDEAFNYLYVIPKSW